MNFFRLLNLLLYALVSDMVTAVKKPKEKDCDGVDIRGKFHKKEIIAKGIDRAYQLSEFNHTIYLSYNVGNDTEDTFEIGHLKKDDKVPKPITSIKNGFATAIDRANKVAYFGGSEGVYEEDLTKPGEIKHVLKEHNIWDLFFHHHLYYIAYPSHRLYKKVDNNSEPVKHIHEKIYQFAIDEHSDTFIVTKDGLYEIKNGTTDRIHYEGPKVFRAVEINRHGEAYFCGQNGIYTANKKNHTLEEIASIKHIFGLTFDEDNHFIYSNPHEVIRLLPSDCK